MAKNYEIKRELEAIAFQLTQARQTVSYLATKIDADAKSERDTMICRLSKSKNLTDIELGDLFDLSAARISQIIKKHWRIRQQQQEERRKMFDHE